ncbi:MAG: hypothetical protein B7Z75_06940 [Acidocella sp. 20-57-95]|nr:MAG: hypothetical protein B7Z75_06940 [Acidocella sp. 20-57-95]OYV58285.1 MAG: hypothetical protein B7Z71_10655 [Acidocella sp. 21-58-7]
MLKRIMQSQSVQNAMARLAARYLDFVAMTTRWQIEGSANLATFAGGPPCIVAFWHETLPAMPIFWRRARTSRPASVLASRHRDGQLIGAVVKYFDIDVVAGSSSRGGAAGLRALVNGLKAGQHVGLTPDGPRGPRRAAAPGVAQLAALSGAAVLPCAASTRWGIRLKSWDRMRFPLPFGRGILVCGAPILVERNGWERAIAVIETALTTAITRAESVLE